MTEIDLTNNPDMERLIIENNNLTTLNLANNPRILDLEIGSNLFDAIHLDEIIAHIHEQVVTNSIKDGYMDFKGNPGFNDISDNAKLKINEMVSSYNWFFNNN